MRTDNRNLFGVLWLSVAIALFSAGGSAALTSCTTVTPTRVQARLASFDGTDQNSGVIASTATGFVVTAHLRERYNALIATYGGDFAPALKPDAGVAPISDDRWLIDKEHMVKFLTMNQWRKAGFVPKNK